MQINYVLGYDNLKVYQDDKMFKFSLDSVLLPNFVTLSNKKGKILDIGCGNGIISIILTTRTNNKIDAVEIQEDVYDLAVKSIEINKLNNQITLYNQDIKDYANELESDIYDTIVCNPPFFKNMVSNESSYKTIARHEKTLNLDDIMKIAKKLLKNNGNIAIVHRTERLIDIIDTMKKNNIEPKKMQLIYPRKNNESNMLLIEGTKNGNPGLKVLEPLYIYDENEYSSQLIEYLRGSL